jgi:hypothetical protein
MRRILTIAVVGPLPVMAGRRVAWQPATLLTHGRQATT